MMRDEGLLHPDFLFSDFDFLLGSSPCTKQDKSIEQLSWYETSSPLNTPGGR